MRIKVSKRSALICGFILVDALAAVGCKYLDKDSENKSIDNAMRGNEGFHLNYCQPDNEALKNEVLYGAADSAQLTDDGTVKTKQVTKTEYVDKLVKSADTFAGDVGLLDQTFASARSADSKSVREHIRDVLTAAPIGLVHSFFGRKGKIHLTNGIPDTCAKGQGTDQRNSSIKADPISCVTVENQGGRIYLGVGSIADKPLTLTDSVRHGLMRGLSFYYAILLVPSVAAEFKKIDPTSADFFDIALKVRGQLPTLLEMDMKKTGFGSPQALEGFKAAGAEDLKTALMAESMDSVFCSKETREIFAACFPTTFQGFLDHPFTQRQNTQFGKSCSQVRGG